MDLFLCLLSCFRQELEDFMELMDMIVLSKSLEEMIVGSWNEVLRKESP